MKNKKFNLNSGRIMDWDQLLSEILLIGLDFQVIMSIRDIELFRGPMGYAMRVGDTVYFHPNWIAFKRRGGSLIITHTPEGSDAPSAHLMHSKLLELPDTTIMIVDSSGTPLFCLHPRGDNISVERVPRGITFH